MSALRGRLPTIALVVVLVAGAIVAAVLAASGPTDGPPLSPESTAATGTRALTEILERLGADVVVDPGPPEDVDSVLLLVDNLEEDHREDLEARADAGATLVVTDPGSPLAPEPVGSADLGLVATPISRDCDLPALADAERILPGSDWTYEIEGDAVGCYPRGAGAWLVAEPRGQGALVVTGGPGWVTNGSIDEADNALLATALLAPGGSETVGIIAPEPTAPGEGETDPLALVPDWVWFATAQLGVAGLLLAWWRARRLGAPVVEDQPVRLPGSELVLALGGLHAARSDTRHAAATIREGLRRDAARRLGLPPDAEADAVAQAALDARVDPDAVELALQAPLPADDDGLVTLARAVEDLRTGLSASAAEPGTGPSGARSTAGPSGAEPAVPSDRSDPNDPTRGAARV